MSKRSCSTLSGLPLHGICLHMLHYTLIFFIKEKPQNHTLGSTPCTLYQQFLMTIVLKVLNNKVSELIHGGTVYECIFHNLPAPFSIRSLTIEQSFLEAAYDRGLRLSAFFLLITFFLSTELEKTLTQIDCTN